MIRFARLDIDRQRIVGNSVGVALAVNRPVPLLQGTVARGQAVVAATAGLQLFAGVSASRVNQCTKSVVVALEHTFEEMERGLRDTVVPMGEPQQRGLALVRFLRGKLFPEGTRFIRRSMDLQWSELVVLRTAMQEPEVSEAIDELGLRRFVDHLLAHIELYGRMVGQEGKAAGAGEEEASAAWTEAFQRFAAQVMLDYEESTAMQSELLGAYDTQLGQQRAAARAAIKARKAQAEAEEPEPPSVAPAA